MVVLANATPAIASLTTSAAEDNISIRLGSRGSNRTIRCAIGDTITVTYRNRSDEITFTGVLEKYREFGRGNATLRVMNAKGEGRTLIVGDIVKIEVSDAGSSDASSASESSSATGAPKPIDKPNTSTTPKEATSHGWGFPTDPGVDLPGLPKVFLLPIEGGVGDGTRHDEMEKIGKIADSYGPGQIIVLRVNSPGGLVLEADLIHETLRDIKTRHRVIAWIEEAISAAAFTAFHCNEVYFMKTGALGSATMFAGGKAIEGEQLQQWIKKFGDVAEESDHPRALAEAMITNSKLCSYDPADGDKEPLVYGTLEGEIPLSTAEENLTINAHDAIACGFADGVADNEEELGELLLLPRWYETTDDGRKIHRDWHKTLDMAKLELPRLGRQLQGQIGQGNDPIQNINRRLMACRKLIAWSKRLGKHTGMMMQVPPVERLEQVKKQLEEELRRLKAAR